MSDLTLPFAPLAAAEDAKTARRLTRELARTVTAADALAALKTAKPPLRGRLTALAGELAARTPDDTTLRVALRQLTSDADLKTAGTALQYLGSLADGAALPTAVKILDDRGTRIELKYAAMRALMEAGAQIDEAHGDTIGRLLATAAKSDDAKLRALASEAAERRRRDTSRDGTARVRLDVTPRGDAKVVLRCRAGLTDMLVKELAGTAPEARQATTNTVVTPWRGPLAGLCVARLWDRLGIVVPVRPGKDFVDTIVESLGDVSFMIRHLTLGSPSFRLEAQKLVSAPGRLPWRLSEALRAVPGVIANDPRQSTWELEVAGDANRPETLRLTLWAKAIDDPRFAYRTAEVPAASHPTIAAALALVGGARESDVIWDPFVGSGLELVERARLGSYKAMVGTDVDPEALVALRKNLQNAGVDRVETLAMDARRYADLIETGSAPRPTLILTNPPFGRRVATDTAIQVVMEIAQRAFTLLSPGGRIVWMSPQPSATADAMRRAGLTSVLRQRVDMGGFSAEMQVFSKPQRR
jgi:predicted RNA methylase